jgi:branched-chain amino acid transport system substrate-binding protein
MLDRRKFLQISGSAAALTAAGGLAPARAQSETLNLAVVVGLTGAYNIYATELQKGIDLAVEIINKEGLEIGGKNYTISTQYYDDKTEATTAGRLVERAALSDGAHMILASGGSAIVKANVAVAQRIRRPMMALWSQVDGVYAPQKGDPWLFSALPPFSRMYRRIMKLASELKDPEIKTASMVTPNDELGVYSGEEYFPADLKEAGIELLGVEFYPPGSQEYATAVARARRQNPDCLVINALGNDIVAIVKEMQSIDWFPKMVVIESPTGVKEPLGDVINGMHVPLLWDASIAGTTDRYVGTGPDFIKLYAEKYGNPPLDFVAAVGAHDVIAYTQVLQKAGVVDDPEAIREAFRTVDAETFFGANGFDDDGLNRAAATHCGQFQDGQLKIVYPEDIRSAEPIHPYPGWKA